MYDVTPLAAACESVHALTCLVRLHPLVPGRVELLVRELLDRLVPWRCGDSGSWLQEGVEGCCVSCAGVSVELAGAVVEVWPLLLCPGVASGDCVGGVAVWLYGL